LSGSTKHDFQRIDGTHLGWCCRLLSSMTPQNWNTYDHHVLTQLCRGVIYVEVPGSTITGNNS
jgi:hypothetical protein